MVGLLLFQSFKHQIHRVLELLVILSNLHGVQKLDQGGEVLLLHRCFVVDIADQGTVQKGFSLRPELVTGFAVALGVGDQGGHQLQNVLLTMNIGEGVIVHGLLEVDGVEDLDVIAALQQSVSALDDDAALGIGDNIAGVHLEQVGLQPEAGLTGARAADDQNILVSGVGGVLRSVGHHQMLCPGEDDIVLEFGISERLDVLGRTPAGRAVFHIVPILLGVLALQVNSKPHDAAAENTDQKISGMEAGHGIGERRGDGSKKAEELCREICTLGHSPRFSDVGCQQSNDEIRDVQNQKSFQLFLVHHRSRSCFFSRIFFGREATTALSFASCFRTLGRFSWVICFARCSLTMASRTSPSLAFTNTR